MPKLKEPVVFGLMSADGEITRLIQAASKKQLRDYLVPDSAICKPSTLTVAKLEGKVKVEDATGASDGA